MKNELKTKLGVNLPFAILSAAAVVILFYLYRFPLSRTAATWGTEYNTHGLLIFLMSLFLFWRLRHIILRPERGAVVWGLAAVCACLLLYLGARRGQINSIMTISFIFLLYALALFLRGWKTANRFAFPIFFLLFSVQLGLVNSILSVKLRILSTIWATAIIDILGIPARRVGTYVYMPHFQFDIASPCSGLNSLISLTALSFVFAYLTQKVFWKRLIIVIMAVPIALANNVSRIVGIGLASIGFGEKFAIGVFHTYSGYFTFGFGLFCLVGIGTLLSKIKESQSGNSNPQAETCEPKPATRKPALLHLGIIVGLLIATLFTGQAIEKARHFSKGIDFEKIPLSIGGWEGEILSIAEKELQGLPADTDHFRRRYTREGVKESIFLAIVQSKSDRHSIHPPEACFPAQGWSIGTPTPFKVDVGGGKVITVNKFEAKFRGYREIIIYWYQTEAMMITKYPFIPLITAKDLILYGRNDRWAFIRLSSPVGEKAEEIEERMKDFILDLWKYVQYED